MAQTNIESRGTETYATRLKERLTSREVAPYYFILPFFVVYGIFYFYPLVEAVFMSFRTYSLGGSYEFVGLVNYQNIFSGGLFLKSVANTFAIAAVIIPLQVVFGLIIAVILNSAYLRFRSGFRAAFIAPLAVSMTVIAIVFNLLLSEGGLLNFALNSTVGFSINWLTDTFWAKISVGFVTTYKFIGLAVIIYLAGLQGIPQHLYEAARIDGAGPLQRFWYITVPQLRPIILLVTILTTSRALRLFAVPFVLTSGGPSNSSLTVVHLLYQVAFQEISYGRAAAIGTVLAIILGSIMILQYRLGQQEDRV